MASSTKKTVLITGATRGIGLKSTELYTKAGWNVIGAARNLDKADQLRALSPYKMVQIDVGDEASILSSAKQLEGEAIDLLINNAGYLEGGGLDETTKDGLLRQFSVNAVGPLLMTRAFTPHMKAAVAKHGAATVVQIGSSMGSLQLSHEDAGGQWQGYYGYRASKAALHMINTTLAHVLKIDKIAAFTLHPGWVVTEGNGNTGYLDTQTSVTGLIKVIDTLTLADTGKFFDYNGDAMPW